MMKIQKREYEERAVRNLRSDLAAHARVLAVSPTGSGKTVIAAMLISAEPRWRKVLWLAHRYELVDQAYSTLSALGLDVGIAMAQEERLHGDRRRNPDARVQVASVQTVTARGVPAGVDLVVFDEAHRVMADSYQEIARDVGTANVLGLTATPCRLDGKGLGEFFEEMRVIAVPSELQADGYLATPRTFSTPREVRELLEMRLAKVPMRGGDYAKKELSKVATTKALIGKVVAESMRLAPGAPKVVFACSVYHSKRIVMEYSRRNVSAMHIDGYTPADVRARAVEGLRTGAIEVICNVDVLTEGWDLPSLAAVVVARPTKSVARFLQMTGRVTRPYGEQRPLVIDHGGNVQRLDVIPGEDIAWELETGLPYNDGFEPTARACDACGAVLERGCLECGECGAGHEPVRTAAEERREAEAHLEEVTRAEMDAMRARVEEMARRKGMPNEWAERVCAEMEG